VRNNTPGFHRNVCCMHRPIKCKNGLIELFLRSAAIILICTAVMKVISAVGEVLVLSRPDPLFAVLTNRQVLVSAAAVELGTATILLRWQSVGAVFRLGVLGWLCCIFLAYRFGLWWINYQGECRCLGMIAEWVPLSPLVLEWFSRVLLAYCLLGSAVGLLYFTFADYRARDHP
jgi:hypothetical protein